MAFVVMCAEKILRLLHLIFVTIFLGCAPGNGLTSSREGSGTCGRLRVSIQ